MDNYLRNDFTGNQPTSSHESAKWKRVAVRFRTLVFAANQQTTLGYRMIGRDKPVQRWRQLVEKHPSLSLVFDRFPAQLVIHCAHTWASRAADWMPLSLSPKSRLTQYAGTRAREHGTWESSNASGKLGSYVLIKWIGGFCLAFW